ncbi:MAG: NADP oxidoreductase [Kouleothrix sp.]|nr:NADP oxidoreductase [Kouleothrix sp.]
MSKPTLATVWLDGCSGCHMSLLDIDDRLIALLERADLVYSPLVDAKIFPDMVDITLVEGSVSNEDDLAKIRHVRAHTTTLVSLGDCAVMANVPGMRNIFSVDEVLRHAYYDTATHGAQTPNQVIPALLPRVRPVHSVVAVDVFVPGCPPSADTIFAVLSDLLDGRIPDVGALTRFGA